MRVRLLALALAFGLAACAGAETTLPLTVRISNVRLGSVGLLSQELLIDLRVGNPNAVALPLRGLTFELDINGRHFASGLGYAAIDVAPLSHAVVPVRGNTDVLGIIRQIMTLAESGRLSYRIHGKAYIGGLGRHQAVPYEHGGELSLLPNPDGRAAPGGMRTLRPL